MNLENYWQSTIDGFIIRCSKLFNLTNLTEELSPHTAGAGAVFIFILGLGMSIVMVLIVGCRLRRVARRQRGKNRLDPDYLVDGMYL